MYAIVENETLRRDLYTIAEFLVDFEDNCDCTDQEKNTLKELSNRIKQIGYELDDFVNCYYSRLEAESNGDIPKDTKAELMGLPKEELVNKILSLLSNHN